MRHILAASLLLSSLIFPAVAKASQPVDDASAPTPVRVSTGVIAPVLLNTASLALPEGYSVDSIPSDTQVGLSFIIDEKGQPTDIHVSKSYDSFWDARVIDTVRKFHYRPGTVDSQPIPIDMNLTVNVAR
ncbi:MAG: energy transducer TonB [Terracidiphilus sp.]|jgi:TonB family protein